MTNIRVYAVAFAEGGRKK